MAFWRQASNVSSEESLLYSYWSTVLQFLKMGISWEAIMEFTDSEMSVIMGVEMAYNQRENEEQAKQAASSRISNMHRGMM
jgi:hypothetical protein